MRLRRHTHGLQGGDPGFGRVGEAAGFGRVGGSPRFWEGGGSRRVWEGGEKRDVRCLKSLEQADCGPKDHVTGAESWGASRATARTCVLPSPC